jgi:2-iminobutanoate/2-iminopropanoate deaminase
MTDGRTVISTPAGPAAIGPYSQAVSGAGLVFVSGQIALDPATGSLIGDMGIESQTRQCLRNLAGILSGAGASLDRALKLTIYLTDMAAFGRVNAVYGEFFGDEPPARATVAVSALPLGAGIEIDCIALAGES